MKVRFRDPSRHGTDVSLSVAADLCLITDTAKTMRTYFLFNASATDFSQWRSYRFPEGLPDRGSGSFRLLSAYGQQGIPGCSFDFFETVMILLPESSCFLQILGIFGMPYPTEAQEVSRYSLSARCSLLHCCIAMLLKRRISLEISSFTSWEACSFSSCLAVNSSASYHRYISSPSSSRMTLSCSRRI